MNHAPLPYSYIEAGAIGGTGFHLYLTDTNNRKIAAVWGRGDEKRDTAALMLAGANHAQALADALEEALGTISQMREDYARLNQVLQNYKDAME